MKYFTLFSLTLLAVNASSSDSASTNSENAPNPLSTLWSELVYTAKNFLTTPKNLIKARLELPKPLTADKFVSISPTENICVFPTKSEFWKTLFAQTDPVMIEKIIFCPEAIEYLGNLSAAKLTSSKSVDELRPIIAALLLRRETLINKYSKSYIDTTFNTCYNALWAKLNDTATPYWPCNGSPCTPANVTANFAAFTDTTPACKEILKDQLAAYADKVAEITAAPENPVTSAVDLREAIRENLSNSPHFSVAFSALVDTVAENSKIAAAEKIQAELADVKAILEKQSEKGAEVYSKAVEDFNSRLKAATVNTANVNSASVNNASVNTDSSIKTDSSVKTDSSIKTDSSVKTDTPSSATKTVNEPTKTTK